MMRLEKLMPVAGAQYGCITYDQAIDLVGRRSLERMCEAGALRRVHPRTYVVVGFPNMWHQRAMAAILSVPGAALSHRCAAKLHGLTFRARETIEITTPREFCVTRDDVVVHRSEQLRPYVEVIDGLRVTNVARTLVDLSRYSTYKQLAAQLDQACHKELVTLPEVRHCLDRMVTKGRSRISYLREALDVRTETDEKLESFFEKRTLDALRIAGLPEIESQVWVFANGTDYRLDFCYPQYKIAFEPDGPHHLLPSVAAYDRVRDADLMIVGWIVMRINLESEPHVFIRQLKQAIAVRAAAA